MAKGPAWTSWEDEVLEAARLARVAYMHIPIVMPTRTAEACKVRANILRRQRGVPSRDYAHLDQSRWASAAARGSEMLGRALMNYGGQREVRG